MTPIFFLLLIFTTPLWGQEQNDENIIPIDSNFTRKQPITQPYRPGVNFQSVPVNTDNSLANLIDSPAINIETSATGRIGAIRIDGATTSPMLGIDGFIIKDPGINQGQFILDLLPYDFSTRTDIYKQNMVSFGINAGSLIDFRIPIYFENYITLNTKVSTTANIYAKVQGEHTFENGSTFFGIVGDLGLRDYYYAIDKGMNFETYPNSTYERFSFISKTTWKGLEFLIANTFTDSFGETANKLAPICSITRNNLITGLRYQQNIFFINANYTFYNQFITSSSFTNDYLNHQLTIQTGIKDRIDRYQYQIALGYEFNNIDDGSRASVDNYQTVPKFGEHFFNIITEFGASVHKEEDNPIINADFNMALNQIISSTGLYIPVPSLTIGLRHRNGFYSSTYISRVYVIPDLTTAYGFGLSTPTLNRTVLPKDGIRSGIELGINKALWRIYANFSYSWLDKGFRLAEDNTIINSDNVTAISLELGGEYKHFINNNIIEFYTGLAWTEEKDNRGFAPSPNPTWKWIAKITAKNIEDTWNTMLTYKLVKDVPNGGGFVDKIPRHYLDLNIRYKLFVLNILNIANQSYRPIPENIYSPYNPGVRAEFGIEYKY